MKKFYLLLFVISLSLTSTSFAQLTVTGGTVAAQLVDTLLGTGITAANITYTGNANAKGLFKCPGGCNVGFSSGILLTSGSATVALPPNTGTGQGVDNGAGSDPSLASVASGLIFNASVLEFDFSVASDSVAFRYIFASEEYNDYVNGSVNDVFGFFISGPGIVGQRNIAIVPGTTTTSVSINNVNNGNSAHGTPPPGPCEYCAYYRDNTVGSPITSAYDGFTTPLVAGCRVRPCEMYHIKLAIGDVGDGVFDSGVFLEANSFNSIGQISLYSNGNLLNPAGGNINACTGTSVTLSVNPASTYAWNNGATTQSIVVNESNVSPAGYNCVVINPVTGCFTYTPTYYVNFITPTATITPLGSTTLCTGGNVNLQANVGNSYLWSNGATTQTINVTTAGNYTVTVTQNGNCSAVSSAVNVSIGNAVASISGNTAYCAGGNTTLTANAGQTYLWSNGATTQAIPVSAAGNYTVTVTQAGGCSASASKTVIVNALPNPVIAGTASVCQGVSTNFNAGAGYTNYLWSNGATTQNINVGTAGPYTVTVTDANGCSKSTSVNLVVNTLPVPVIAGITSFCSGGNSTLNAGAGYSNYTWSTGVTTQTINVTASSNYSVTVTNGSGCVSSTSVNVVVHNLPSPSISGNLGFCQGANTTITANNGYTNYNWSNGATTQSINTSSAATYTVTVTDANGCTGTKSALTVINPLPNPAITGNTAVCQGSNTIFNAGAGYSNYVWSTGATTQNINVGTAGPYTVTVTDANGCSRSTNSNLVVNPVPVPVIAGITSFCAGGNSTLNAGAGYSNYLWSTGVTTQTISVSNTATYTVTVTNGFVCTASTSTNVIAHALPVPAITGNLGFCQGTNTTLNAGNGFSFYQWSTGSTTQTIAVSSASSFTVTVTNSFGCTGTATTATVINPLPNPVVTGTTSVCNGTNTSFDAGTGYSQYVWSNGATTRTINPGVAGMYTVTVTDVNGCSGSDNVNLTVNPVPAPAITGLTAFCQGNQSVLNGGAGFSSYTWSTGATTQTINVNSSANYTVTVTNGFNCSASSTVNVVVHPLPNPVIAGGTGICTGSTTVLDAGNSNYVAYNWSTGATTQDITVSNGGNYTITVTDNFGCSNSTFTTMVVNPLPVPNITGDIAICQNTTTAFDAGSGYAAYVWSTGNTTGIIHPGVAGNYSVMVTDANGCTGTDNINLVVNSLPAPIISGNTVFCQNDNTTLNAGAGYVSYQWSNAATTQTINTSLAGNYSVIVTDANGCSESTTAMVIVNPLPSPFISGPAAICDQTSAVLDGGNYSNYLWSTGETTQAVSVSNAGAYSVSVTDANGCANTSSPFNIIVYPLPDAIISDNTPICIGASADFKITFTGSSPFRFSYTDGVSSFGPFTTSNNPKVITVSPTDTRTYSLTTLSDLHCTGTFSGSATVTVNPLPSPVISGIDVICDGSASMFDAGTGYSSYIWSTGETTQTISVTDAGNYSVVVIDNNTCINGTSKTLTVNETPVVAFSNDSSLTCEIPLINFFDGSTFPVNSSFLWDFGDGSTSIEENTSHEFSISGVQPISLTITTPQGCVGSLMQPVDITFVPLPIAKFKLAPSVVSIFNSTVNFIDQSQNGIKWEWYFGDGKLSGERSPSYLYSDIGKYTVKFIVTNIAGCVSEFTDEVLVTPFFIPSGFTPNGDGLNEVFFDPGFNLEVAALDLTVWNKWGEKIFQTDNMHKPWTGFDKNGKPAPMGTYVYTLKVLTKANKKFAMDGTITLVR